MKDSVGLQLDRATLQKRVTMLNEWVAQTLTDFHNMNTQVDYITI